MRDLGQVHSDHAPARGSDHCRPFDSEMIEQVQRIAPLAPGGIGLGTGESARTPSAAIHADQPHARQPGSEVIEIGPGAGQPGERQNRNARALLAPGDAGAVIGGEISDLLHRTPLSKP